MTERKFPEGSLASKLQKEIDTQSPITKADPAAPKPPRKRIDKVRSTGGGITKLQGASARAKIMAHIEALADKTAVLEDLESSLGFPCRGHLQKLVETKHLEIVQ